MSSNQQLLVRKRIQPVIKTIQSSEFLLNALVEYNQSNSLVLRILVILTDTVQPTKELVNAVKIIYEKNKDARLLVPVISGFEKVVNLLH